MDARSEPGGYPQERSLTKDLRRYPVYSCTVELRMVFDEAFVWIAHMHLIHLSLHDVYTCGVGAITPSANREGLVARAAHFLGLSHLVYTKARLARI